MEIYEKFASTKRRMVGMGIMFGALLGVLVCAAPAAASGPYWHVLSTSAPRYLPPGGEGTIVVLATNLGDQPVRAVGSPVTVTDRLPPGLTATGIANEPHVGYHNELNESYEENIVHCPEETGSVVQCEWGGELDLPPYETMELRIGVKVDAHPAPAEENEVSITGGEAPPVTVRHELTTSSLPTPFGVEDYELSPENENGSPDSRAGSHPFQLTTTLSLNQTVEDNLHFLDPMLPSVPALTRNLNFRLPPGLIGDPTPFSQCTELQFETQEGYGDLCPPGTVVGVALITANEPKNKGAYTLPVPLFNLVPQVGEPARFGFMIIGVPVILDTSVRTGEDYGVTVSVRGISQAAAFITSQIVFWGVPGDPRHDSSRDWGCIGEVNYRTRPTPCEPLGESQPPPLLTLPTSCSGVLRTSVLASSWPTATGPGIQREGVEPVSMESLDSCNQLSFDPGIVVVPDGGAGSTPSGLSVDVHVPQGEGLVATGRAEADVRDTTVVLPEGLVLNPAAADGLLSCSVGEVALGSAGGSSCPEGSKVGTVAIRSPLLPDPLVGSVYLAAQDENPFGSLVALYIVAEDPEAGVVIKVAGEVRLDPVTGRIVSTFDDTPQLPFEDLELHFFGGDRAPLATPGYCGSYVTSASIVPWSGGGPAEPSSTFDITSGPNGSPCPASLAFAPGLTAGTTSVQAGGFSPFTMTVSREDGQQSIQAIQLRLPPGLSGLLAGVELCGEAQADAGTCGPGSLIGETTVSVGLGGDPYSVTGGKVYITGPYGGAPFGVSVVVPAKAGPYDLGSVVVRGRIEVDPTTSALTVSTDSAGPYAIPHILDGIPLEIKHVNFTTTRPAFTFNPTDCEKMGVAGSISSVEGASSAVSVPFQVTDCAALAFKPVLTVSTSAKTSRTRGASLHVGLTLPAQAGLGTEANVARVRVSLPKQLPAPLKTLQKACTEVVFDADPAGCPVASQVGQAAVSTPLLSGPLTGPAYFVSHGGAKYPELVIVLRGEDGVTVQVHGETFISKTGITTATFASVPDVPFSHFELTLPQREYPALTANGSLCKAPLVMPTEMVGQNGAVITQSTRITVTGCQKAKHAAHKKSTVHKKKGGHGKGKHANRKG
jgi:hypothetical protein